MSVKKIIEYVPAEADKELLQVRVDEELKRRVNRQRCDDMLTWQELVEACFRRYLDETGGKNG